MSTSGLEGLDHSVQVTHQWIKELDRSLGWDNRSRTFRLLRVVLHTLRDCLPVAEIADFSAQMPTVLRGVFFEQWRPDAERARFTRDIFLVQIDQAFEKDPIENVSDAVSCVFAFLGKKISAGEISDVRQSMPHDVRTLWPQ